jgi:hypothetical protein
MKEKDFKSLSVDEQKEKINELVISWYEQDSDNRCAVVILGDRNNEKDAGKSSCCVVGPGSLITVSLGTMLKDNEDIRGLVAHSLMGPLGGLLDMFNKSKEEEK